MQQFLRREGGEVRSLLLLRKYTCQVILFTCSHIAFTMVYSFYFLCFGSRRNEFNSLWGGIRGRNQKSTTYSENISVMKFYLSTLTLQLRCSLHYADFFQVSLMIKMIPQAIAVHDAFIIILSQYIIFINACHTLHDAHLAARMPRLFLNQNVR